MLILCLIAAMTSMLHAVPMKNVGSADLYKQAREALLEDPGLYDLDPDLLEVLAYMIRDHQIGVGYGGHRRVNGVWQGSGGDHAGHGRSTEYSRRHGDDVSEDTEHVGGLDDHVDHRVGGHPRDRDPRLAHQPYYPPSRRPSQHTPTPLPAAHTRDGESHSDALHLPVPPMPGARATHEVGEE